MADIQANIGIGVDTTQALASIRALQRQISAFHTSMAKGGAAAGAQSAKMQQNLVNTINSSGKFSASMVGIQSSTESFTNALEKNKLSMGQYFRYAGGASRSFGKMFSREFNTISNVAQERVKDLQTQYVSMGRNANGALQSIKVRPLTLDMDNLGTKVQLAGQKQQIFNQLMKQGTTNLLNFGKNTQWAGRQLMVGFTIPLTIFGALAAKEFKKLEEQAVKFRRVYGDMFTTDADTEKALSNVRELADEFTKYGIAVEKTIGLAAKVAQMGNVGTDLTAQVTQATRLAVLGGMEQEEALNTTISLTNAFGIAAEDLAGKIAFLNAAENQTVLSIEDFNTAIPLAGSVVQQLGGNVEDLAFFLTAMREGGISASQGANALKTSLARIVAPTEVAKKEMAGFGIDIVGIVENNVGNLKQTILELGQELDTLDPLNRARAIEQLFGKFQFARMSTMFQNISKDGSQARKVLDLTSNSMEELAIIAERELKAVEESPAFKLQKQMEQLKAALAPIGEEFVKAVGPLLEFGTKLLKSFNNLGDGGKQFIVVATAIAGVVLPAALMGFGLVANGAANLVKMFAFLGGAFGRISGQSRILGTGTEYLTQEQVQAAAVAASLGQSHTNLIQVFSSETAAINGLISAYTRAIAAQNAFSGSARIAGAAAGAARASANIPKTTRYNPFLGPQAPKKYTKGVLSVPGPKGAGDVVPAMLSPGEAVVPAVQAQKYAPFINSIIADNVPGFFGGRFALPRDRQFGHMDSGFGVPAEFLTQFPEGSKARRSGDMFTAAGAGQRNVNAKSSWGRGQDPELNRLSATGDAPFKAQRADFAAGGAADFFPAVSEAGFDPSNSSIAKDVQEYQDLFMQLFDEADTAGAKFVADTDSNLAAKKERVRAKLGEDFDNDRFDRENVSLQTIDSKTSELRAGTPTAQARQSGSSTVKEFRATTLTKEEEAAILASGDPSAVDSMGSYYKRSDRTTNRGAQIEVPKRDKKIAQTAKSFASPQDDSLKASGLANAEAYNDGLEAAVKDAKDVASEMAGRNSPHPEAFPDGADDARDYVRGQESVLSSGSDPYASSSSAPPPPPMMPTPPIAKSGKFFGNIKDRAKSAGNKAMDLGLQTGPGKKMANYFAETSGANITNSKGQIVSTLHQEVEELGRASKKAAGQVDDNTQSIQENGNAAGAAGDIKDNIARDQQGNPILGSNGSPVTNKEIKRTANQQKRQARAGKALGALGTATMVAGMATQAEGRVGEIAQQVVGPMAALSGIAPLLMALPAPIAALVAVIGLGVAAWMLYNKTLEKARKEAFELTRALGSGKDAIKKFAEASGKATSSEIMDKKREDTLNPYETQPGKTPFGESFVGSEDGAALVDSLQTAISSRGMDFAQESLSRQLQAALLDGTLTIQQARGIALALGQELDDLGLSMRVNAELNEIFGPEGENLLENPLEIQVNFMENTTDSILEASTDFENTMEGLSFWNTVESVSEGYITEMEKVAPWLEENVPTWARVASLGIIDVGANSTAAAKGLWKGGLEPVKEYGEAAGHYVGELINGLESYQGAIDSTSTRYDRMIADAESEGNGTLASELRAEKIQAEIDILEAYQQQMQTVSKDFTEAEDKVRSALSDEIDIQLKTKFEEDPEQKKILDQSLEKIAALGLDEETEYFLKLNVAADNFSLTTLDYLSGLEDGGVVDAAVDVAMNIGGKDADLAVQVAKMFGSDAEGLESQTEFLTRLSTEDPEDAKKTLSAMTEFAKLTGLVGKDADIYMRAALEMDETKMENFQKDMDYLNGLDGAEITTKMITEHIGEDVAGIISDNQEYFDSLAPDQQLRYTMIVNTLMTAVGSPEFTNSVRAWAASKGWAISISDDDAIALAPRMIADLADRGTRGAPVASVEEATPPGNTGSGGSEPQVDSLLKKLRDLRIATIDMKKGWEGMQEVLSSIFAGGTKDLNLFNGLEKQIRNLGVGEGLIAQIVGMDPEEYDKRKNELFEFDNFGNIIGAKAALTNMNEAFDAVAIGDYVNGQEKFITKTKNQISGISTLVASGMSLADAYEAVQDEALAAAIAQGATREEIEEILRVTKLAKELEKDLEAQREKSRISEAVRKTNEEFRNQVAVLKELSKAQGEYSDEQIKAIMTDTDMQKLLLDPTIDSDALKEALRNAEQQANLSVQVNLLTKSGQEEEFDKYLTEINDYFTKKENGINVNFDLATADDNKLIEDAQNQIADIQYKLDDYNAELEQISWIEEDINEKYDRRSEALDQIADTNERIANEQKAQLDIADALSRGDIAAAARAAQELRNQQSQDAQQTQKEQLDKAREAELKAILGPAGRSREQLEEEITQLERQLFFIEEDVSEPAQERNRLAGIARDLAVEQLMLNEMTRAEFDQIAASTKEASINLEDMVTSAEKLSALAEFIKTGTKGADWNRLFPQPKAARRSAPSGGGGAKAASSGPNVTKGDWYDPGTGGTIKAAAAAKGQHWTTYYNENRGAIDPAARVNKANGGMIIPKRMAVGGFVGGYSSTPVQMNMGGRVKGYAAGGFSMGSDIVPAMLTPGEYVVRRRAVQDFGMENLEKINSGTYNDGSVYTYNLAVNVKSDADPSKIARTVITQIKQVENQRIRGNKL